MLFDRFQLEQEEKVLATVRRHWFVLAIELFAVVLMALLPFAALIILAFTRLQSYGLALEIDPTLLIELVAFFVTGWLCFCVLTGYMIWTHYYLDLWIITDRRIVMIDQIHFFNRSVSSLRLERLQDLVVVVSGIIQTFLNFGHIRVQTAGADKDNFLMRSLPDPHGLHAMIQTATDKRLSSLQQEKSGVQ